MEEREGLNIDFYFILWEKYKELYHSTFGVGLPHTVVFRNQYPIAWFFTNKEDQILKKRNVSLNNEEIFHHFTTKKKTKSDVLGYFIEKDLKDNSTQITYFDEPKLREFLENVNLRPERGVLQQFIDPVGENNALYRASWSERSCMISKKVNQKNLFTKNLNIYERCCTFEGHHIFSEEGTVAGGLLPGVIRKCMERIHLHIFALSEGNSLFKRADGFFKQDATGKIWFLWNNCYRILLRNAENQKNYISNHFYSNKLNMRPLSLETAIKIPDTIEKGATYDQRRPNQLQKDLLCLNCNEVQKHQNFAPIAYKYLIFSREVKNKDHHVEVRKKKQQTNLDESLVQEDHKRGNEHGEGGISQSIARLNSQILNENNDIDNMIDEINSQRVVIDDKYKITVPEIFQKIHPRMTDYAYQNIKDNPKFYSKQFWVCQNCYLNLIQYNQLESGCKPQLNYKQIISEYHENKPKPLKKELIKFQNECFNMFLEENQYQQAVRQGCSRDVNIENYYKNRKRTFYEQLRLQQLNTEKQKSLQSAVAEKKNRIESQKIMTEEEKYKCRLNLFRDKQKKVTDHIDFILTQAQHNSISCRPSTSMTTFSKNTQSNSQQLKANHFKKHRKQQSVEGNIIDNECQNEETNQLQQSTSQSSKMNGFFVNQLHPDELNEYNSLHSTLHESQGSVHQQQRFYPLNMKDYESNPIYERDYIESEQSNSNIISGNNEPNEQTQNNLQNPKRTTSNYLNQQISDQQNNHSKQQHLSSPTNFDGQVILFNPKRSSSSHLISRKFSQCNLTNNDQQQPQRFQQNSAVSEQIQNSVKKPKITTPKQTFRPVSSERSNMINSFQETGFQFRSKTPSLSIGSRTHYSVGQSQSVSTNISHRAIPNDINGLKSYLSSPKYSQNSSKELSNNNQKKPINMKNSTKIMLKKKEFKDICMDTIGQQVSSLHQNYISKKNEDQTSENEEIQDLQNIINHYARVDYQNDSNLIDQQEQLKKKFNIDMSEEIEEYKKSQLHIDQTDKEGKMNRFKNIQFYPKQTDTSSVRTTGIGHNYSQENLCQPNLKNIKTNFFESNLKNYFKNMTNFKSILNPSDKSQKQHIIQGLYKKYSTSIHTGQNSINKTIKSKNQ